MSSLPSFAAWLVHVTVLTYGVQGSDGVGRFSIGDVLECSTASNVIPLRIVQDAKIDNIQVELPISINYEAPEQTKESNHNPANGQNPSKLTAGRTVCKMLKFAALFIVGLVSLGLAVESMDRKDWAEWRRVAVSMACFAIYVVACYGFVLNFR